MKLNAEDVVNRMRQRWPKEATICIQEMIIEQLQEKQCDCEDEEDDTEVS